MKPHFFRPKGSVIQIAGAGGPPEALVKCVSSTSRPKGPVVVRFDLAMNIRRSTIDAADLALPFFEPIDIKSSFVVISNSNYCIARRFRFSKTLQVDGVADATLCGRRGQWQSGWRWVAGALLVSSKPPNEAIERFGGLRRRCAAASPEVSLIPSY